jgi:hypothetical protein
MLSGTLFSLEFLYLQFFWQVGAYREDYSPEIIRFINDMAWVPFVGMTSTAVILAASIGISILSDRRSEPLVPRWVGWLSLWVSLMWTPGSLNPFFKDGPLAFNGLFAWYIPVVIWTTIWTPAITWSMLRAVRQQQNSWVDPSVSGETDLRQQLAKLTSEFDELRQITKLKMEPVDRVR